MDSLKSFSLFSEMEKFFQTTIKTSKHLCLLTVLLICGKNTLANEDSLIYSNNEVELYLVGSKFKCDTNLVRIESTKYNISEFTISMSSGTVIKKEGSDNEYYIIPQCSGKIHRLLIIHLTRKEYETIANFIIEFPKE